MQKAKKINSLLLVLFSLVLLVFINIFCNKKQQAASTGPAIIDSTDHDSISFVVMGDWGKAGGQFQTTVADQIDSISREYHAQFIITTGDNFYPSGVASINDNHWQASYENIYNKPGQKVVWYPVLGNHDYGLNPQAEVEYSTISNRWKMPARFYTVKKNIDSTKSVLFVFTDTSPFVAGYYGGGYADLPLQDTAGQLSWLKQTLLNSDDKWKIVIGHHPLYSIGAHGNTAELIQRFKPVFLQSNVDFYLSGHDHSLQYLTPPNDPVHYIISGAASENTPVNTLANSQFAQSTPGFMVMVVYKDKVNFYFYNHLGTKLYSRQVKK